MKTFKYLRVKIIKHIKKGLVKFMMVKVVNSLRIHLVKVWMSKMTVSQVMATMG